VEAHKYNEAPSRYFWWSALAVLSAVMKKQIFIDRHYYKLYANIFVILVSKKSGLRKGIPVSKASGLLHKVMNTRIIEGMNSIEGIIKELSTQRTLENGAVMSEAQGILLTGEFDTFLVANSNALTTLTALQNTHEHSNGWNKNLRNSPVENLKNPCITLLAASNQVLFDDLVKAKDTEGGFIARSFIVYEAKRNIINSLTVKPEGLVSMDDLSEYLKEVKDLNGEFKWTNGSVELYDKWYQKISTIDYEDRTGSLERLGDQVLKVAMLIEVSKGRNLKVTKESLQEAIEKSEECITGVKHVTLGSGTSDVSAATAKVLKLILSSPGYEISRIKLLQRLWPDLDHFVLDRIIDTLKESEAIDAYKGIGKIGVVYKMKKEALAQYLEFKGEE
jgi:hypothetical protein